MTSPRQLGVVARLGTTQTLAWASSYYLPALLAAPMATDLGLPANSVFSAFTLALVISGMVGPRAGRAIDELGGRPLLLASNLMFAIGLAGLGLVQNEWQMWLAWAFIGVAMGSGLYDAAFATLVRLYPLTARSAITGITLVAGFASTVGWPITAWWIEAFGWRGACIGWAGLHLLLGWPLHWSLPRGAADTTSPVGRLDGDASNEQVQASQRWVGVAMSAVFAITWFISTAMATHLPTLLQAQGLSAVAALGVAMLVGPAQVAGRLMEFGLLRKVHPLSSARIAASAHPLGVFGFMAFGPAYAWVFAGLHGAGNGILTIAKGTLPLAVFGPTGYGYRQGWLMAPARVAQAAAPAVFGFVLTRWGGEALYLTAALSGGALVLLHYINRTLAPEDQPA